MNFNEEPDTQLLLPIIYTRPFKFMIDDVKDVGFLVQHLTISARC